MKSAPRFNRMCVHFRRRLFQAGLAAAMPALFGQPANVDLPEAAKGERAIEVLGGKLPAVADYYGMKPNELAHLLKIQRSLGVDQKGALLYACEGLAVAAGDSGHGFKFAPVLGEIIADAVEGRATPFTRRFAWRDPAARRTEDARFGLS